MNSSKAEEVPSMQLALSSDVTTQYMKDLHDDPVAQLAMKACWKYDPAEVCGSRERFTFQHLYSHKVEEIKPVANQRSSGRCWIFAALNVMRLPLAKALNIEEFEFSQSHLFFWDKIERANHFLLQMVDCARAGEEVDGRLVSFLLKGVMSDGGQWDMLVNLVNKYGLMPQKCFPDAFSAEKSTRMNRILRSKLREYALEVFDMVARPDTTSGNLEMLVRRQGKEVFRIVSISLGIPPTSFSWQYRDKAKAVHSLGPIEPLAFYREYVKPHYDVDTKVCLVNDPRSSSQYGEAYTVHCLGNVVGGKETFYNNQPMSVLAKASAASIKAGEAVWFGCDVGKCFATKMGYLDLDVHDYEQLFGVGFRPGMDKAQRLLYGESQMTHAMSLTACHEQGEDSAPTKWRVENSWGEDYGDKGSLCLTKGWFDEFVYEVVVDRSFLPAEVLAVQEKQAIVLPAWDPLGALAC